jgi:hypothetical protein
MMCPARPPSLAHSGLQYDLCLPVKGPEQFTHSSLSPKIFDHFLEMLDDLGYWSMAYFKYLYSDIAST